MSQFPIQGLGALGNLSRTVQVRQGAGGGGGAGSSLQDLKTLCSQTTDPADYKLATAITSNIPQYDLSKFSQEEQEEEEEEHEALQDEWYRVLNSGPGVLVLYNFFHPLDPGSVSEMLDKTNQAFDSIMADESSAREGKGAGGSGGGDHFAPPGTNTRIWNSLQKHAERHPTSWVTYYGNPWLNLICETWLGPGYRVTGQANIVHPGGKAQTAHRDYHLGHQPEEKALRFPRGAHLLSQYMTLQGAVAHSDMPLETGPTRFLPFSQLLPEGYLAWRDPEISGYFEENWVSLPLRRGDAVFFNPALFHAAGENRTTTDDKRDRSANLLQVSSCMGRAMESVDSVKVVRSCWGELRKLMMGMEMEGGDREEGRKEKKKEKKKRRSIKACVAAMAEGYPYPSNLDRVPPDGVAPPSEADVIWEGLEKGWGVEDVVEALERARDMARA